MKCDNPGNKKAAERLEVVYRRIEELKLDPGNPRLHSARHIGQIARSITTFGMVAPILIDRSDRVVAGHGRVLACQQLGRTEVPTIPLEHLTDGQAKAYLIADNRLAENSEWDERLLAEQLKQLSELNLDFALDATGFEVAEIDLRIEELSTASERDEARADAVPDPLTDKTVTKPGDMWILNDHRVLCGSALEKDSYAALMKGQKAQMVFTDPPYNVNRRQRNRVWQNPPSRVCDGQR